MTLRVGYAQETITPALDRPVYLAGFGQNRRAISVHDDLYVRALALRDENTTLVLASLDLIGFFRRDVLEVISRVRSQAPQTEILLASTHTHHGPDTMGLWGPDSRHSGVDPVYMEFLRSKISLIILASLRSLQPASVKACAVHVPGLAKNARDPMIVDDELTVAQFLHAQTRRPLASLFNFPCHPEVLWEHNPHITSDYPGYLRQQVENITQAPCIFFSGALGGMMTPDVKDHSFEEAEAMGKALTDAGLSALESAPLWEEFIPVQVLKREFAVKLTNPLFKLAIRRNLIPDVRNPRGEIITEVSLLKIGLLWLAAVPGELLPRLGLEIKAELRQRGADTAGVIGLANDELGYILPPKDFHYPLNPFRPGKHYEETMSVSKEIGRKVMEAVRGFF